ncbi:hypothetical protein PG985_006277 [Apiospora marii]|uniref:Asl1-like glycosyl hydrolase catalytic domain-containing protein n=1 Tax=Apiospora marii TaxID=335849 RepID=A0ABR1S797_9PEZI
MHALFSIVGLALLSGLAQAAPASQARGNNNGGGGQRVGIAVPDKNSNDLKALVGDDSKVDWYYTWELNDSPVIRKANPKAEFLPQVGPRDVVATDPSNPTLNEDSAKKLSALRKSGSKRLLCFNEPDEEVKNGGTGLDPALVAKYYKHVIMPLKEQGWQISHPVVTGSPRGLGWLQKFATECRALNGNADCPTDFVSVHWYGAASGLGNWVGELHDFYKSYRNKPKFWFTELGVPKAGVEGQGTRDQNMDFLTQARQLFQQNNFVEAYAWFGVNRDTHYNAWTGSGVSLFDGNGELNNLGNMLKLGTSS